MDENRLNEIASYARNEGWLLSDDLESVDILRLARLGLWTDRHRLTIEFSLKDHEANSDPKGYLCLDSKKALRDYQEIRSQTFPKDAG